MIIRIEGDDGQDFVVRCDEQTCGVEIGVAVVTDDGNRKCQMEHFTIEESKAAIAALEFAIKIAEVEREEMEKRNGH